jgi:XTP/dITP diphosphohydrolase/tetrapyrrole methylase family protein/MazG family protein/ATP diphosphatase
LNGAEVRDFIVSVMNEDVNKGSEQRSVDEFGELLSIMERLRGPGGCPWDREQTMTDLRPYIVEEAYELTDAITRGDAAGVREESGDLLLQIVFLASIASASGNETERFDIRDVIRTICDKLIRRHPHVFGDVKADGSAQVIRNWEQIKQEERKNKKESSSVLAGVPKGLPPLAKAHRIQGKAAHVGFDWPEGDLNPLFEKLYEEADELREAVADAGAEKDHVEEELGDLLFMTVNLARHLGVSPDAALSRACDKFSARFRSVEQDAEAEGRRLDTYTLSELDALWDNAKRKLEPGK